jgi:hypothetical protein
MRMYIGYKENNIDASDRRFLTNGSETWHAKKRQIVCRAEIQPDGSCIKKRRSEISSPFCHGANRSGLPGEPSSTCHFWMAPPALLLHLNPKARGHM